MRYIAMRQIKDGEKRTVGMKLDGDVVRVDHVTLNKPSKRKFQLTWTFDFNGVSTDDLKRLATRGLVIDQRPKFKAEKEDKKLAQWDNRTFSVKELLAKERKRLTMEQRVEKAVTELPVEQQIELLKKALAAKGVDLESLTKAE